MSQSNDWGLLVAIGLVLVGGYFVYQDYVADDEPPPAPPPVLIPDPPPSKSVAELVAVSDTKTNWFVNAKDVRGPQEKRLVWAEQRHENDATTPYRTTRRLYLIDCTTTSVKQLSQASYKANNPNAFEVVEVSEDDASVFYAIPDSIIAGVFEYACDPRLDPPPK